MQLDLHYTDPRLVDIYDIENSGSDDTDFFLQFADDINARTIVDLGCGTGLLTRELALDTSRKVIGVDPATAMLAYARRQPRADLVEWINGDASTLATSNADLVLMTGNVAQIFLEDADWLATLEAIYTALRPGGYLVFGSRNPAAKAWERWQPDYTRTQFDTPHGEVTSWLELVSMKESNVHFRAHKVFSDTSFVIDSTLRFRSLSELQDTLEATGFTVQNVYGNWQREPVDANNPLMIFVAQRAL